MEMHNIDDVNRGLYTVDGSLHTRKDLQLVKKLLNFFPSKSSIIQVLFQKPEIYMTDKMMSDQVYILISDVPIYEPVVQWYDHRI